MDGKLFLCALMLAGLIAVLVRFQVKRLNEQEPRKLSTLPSKQAIEEKILSLLVLESRKRRRWTCVIGGIFSAFAIFICVAAYVAYVNGRRVNPLELGAWLGGTLVLQFLFSFWSREFTYSHRHALEWAADLERPWAVGYLLEAYCTSTMPDIKRTIEVALPSALANLNDEKLLGPYHRYLLYCSLTTRFPPEIVSGALECAARVAGSEAVPFIELFRDEAAKSKEPIFQRLHERALQILPNIRMAKARELVQQRVNEVTQATEGEAERLGFPLAREQDDQPAFRIVD